MQALQVVHDRTRYKYNHGAYPHKVPVQKVPNSENDIKTKCSGLFDDKSIDTIFDNCPADHAIKNGKSAKLVSFVFNAIPPNMSPDKKYLTIRGKTTQNKLFTSHFFCFMPSTVQGGANSFSWTRFI